MRSIRAKGRTTYLRKSGRSFKEIIWFAAPFASTEAQEDDGVSPIAVDPPGHKIHRNPTDILRVNPPHLSQADDAFQEAHKLGYGGTELIGSWLHAKKMSRDWKDLIDVTRRADKIEVTSDNIYFRAEATGELAIDALRANNLRLAASYYRDAALEIDVALSQDSSYGRRHELKRFRSDFFRNYVDLIDRITAKRDEHIEVWLAMVEAFRCSVRPAELISFGLARLRSWWDAVETREKYSSNSADMLDTQLKQLDDVIITLKQSGFPDDLLKSCRQVSESLAHRLAVYRTRHPPEYRLKASS